MSDPVRIQAIADELTGDPIAIGYTGNDAGDLVLMTTANRIVDVPTLSGSQLFEAIDVVEWQARTADQKDDIRLVIGLGDNIQISTGTKARGMMQNALSGATTSLANLGVLGSKTVTRAEELGFGRVHLGDIQHARII